MITTDHNQGEEKDMDFTNFKFVDGLNEGVSAERVLELIRNGVIKYAKIEFETQPRESGLKVTCVLSGKVEDHIGVIGLLTRKYPFEKDAKEYSQVEGDPPKKE